VKVTLSLGDPAPGAVVGVVHVKEPVTDAVPPLSAELASVLPKVIALAVGQAVTVGVFREVVLPPLFPPHPAAQKLAKMLSQIAGCRPTFIMTEPLFYLPLPLSDSGSGFSGPDHILAGVSRRKTGPAQWSEVEDSSPFAAALFASKR